MQFASLILIVTLAALTHYFAVGRFEGVLTLDGLFVLTMWVMAIGTLVLLDPSNSADELYALVITVPMVLYVVTSLVVYWIVRGSSRRVFSGTARTIHFYRPTIGIWAILLLSAVVTIAYYQSVGYNTFASGIRGLFNGSGSVDYTAMRLDSYNPSRYLYPGYVNQFKNTILPSLSLVVSLYLYKTRDIRRNIVVVALAILSIFALLGTGQRGPFVQFVLIAITFLFLFERKSFFRRAAIIGLATTPLFLLATLLLNRSAQALKSDSGITAKLGTLGQEMLRRFFQDNQFSGQMGFRFTYGQPTQNGREWLQEALGILPRNSGSPLASEIYASLYGTDRGTAPPSLWGSVFYNFAWPGVIVLPVALAVIYQVVTFRSTNARHINTLELVGMAGTFVIFGNWNVSGVEYFLNSGGVTFAILWWLGRRAAQSTSSPPLGDPRRSARARPAYPVGKREPAARLKLEYESTEHNTSSR